MDGSAENLKLNDFLLKTQGMNDASWGRQILSIPLDHMPRILRWYPNWNTKDPIERSRIRMEFARDPRSMPYRVTEKI